MSLVHVDPKAAGVPDDELVRRCRDRDETAVRALTTRYNQRLFRIARGILRDDAEAEDVVQEAYVRAFMGLDRFRGESAFGTWITRIAMNEALGRLRSRRPKEADIVESLVESKAPNPESVVANLQMQHLIERAIDDLPDEFRTIFVARVVEGLSVDETAQLFDLKPETVKTRVHRARARLRTSLEAAMGGTVREAFAFDGTRCARLTEAVWSHVSALNA